VRGRAAIELTCGWAGNCIGRGAGATWNICGGLEGMNDDALGPKV
jgi:hypothetical protein